MKNTILTNTVHFEGKIVHLRKTIDKYEVLLLNLFQLIHGSGQFFIICSEIPGMPDIDVVLGQFRGQSFSVFFPANLHLHHCNNVTLCFTNMQEGELHLHHYNIAKLCITLCRKASVHPELRRLHPAGHPGRTNPGLTQIF